MSDLSRTEIRTYHDLQAQADLERMLKARRDAKAARAAKFRKLPDDTDAPLPAILAWAAAALVAWALFGWGVVELIGAFAGITP